MEFGLKVRLRQEPSFAAEQGFGEPGSVPMKRNPGARSRQPEGQRGRVEGQLERGLDVLGKEVLPFGHVVIPEEVKGF